MRNPGKMWDYSEPHSTLSSSKLESKVLTSSAYQIYSTLRSRGQHGGRPHVEQAGGEKKEAEAGLGW